MLFRLKLVNSGPPLFINAQYPTYHMLIDNQTDEDVTYELDAASPWPGARVALPPRSAVVDIPFAALPDWWEAEATDWLTDSDEPPDIVLGISAEKMERLRQWLRTTYPDHTFSPEFA